PDFSFISAMPYNVGPVVKQFRDAGLTGPIIGGDGYDTPDILSVAGDAGNDGIKKFMAAYETEYSHPVENAFAAPGYDTMYLMADALKRAGSTDPEAI